jgi:hypothetical protein
VTQTPPPENRAPGSEFEAAAAALRAVTLRRDLTAEEIPAPAGVAPMAIAFAGDVHPPDHGIDSQLGTGRFILLHDPEQPEPWDGAFRIVVYAQAPLEREIGSDPLLPEVAWSWLVSALDEVDAPRHAMSGTATTVLSTGFGGRADRAAGVVDAGRRRPRRAPAGVGRVPLHARRPAAEHRGRRAHVREEAHP